MTCRPVDAHRALSPGEIFERYVKTSTPVLLRGAVTNWPARTRWTPEFFRKRYPDAAVELVHCATGERIARRLEDYFTLPRHQKRDWYLCDWNFRQTHRELLEHIRSPTGFDVDWMSGIPRSERPDLLWIYIGHAGTRGPTHVDNYGTSAWLAVLQGKKRVRFVDPRGQRTGKLSQLDLFDDDARPEGLRLSEARMSSGDLLYVPAGCWHAALNPTYCLSVTANFLDGGCFGPHRDFWMRHWHGEAILAGEIRRLAGLPQGADKAQLARHLRRALDQWRETLANESRDATRLATRLGDAERRKA